MKGPSRAKNRVFLNQTRPPKVCKDTSQTNTGPLRPSKHPQRVAQVPLKLTECSLVHIEGFHELIEGLAAQQNALSDQHRASSGKQRTFSEHYWALLSETPACISPRPAKGTLRQIQDQFRPTRAPQAARDSPWPTKYHRGPKAQKSALSGYHRNVQVNIGTC